MLNRNNYLVGKNNVLLLQEHFQWNRMLYYSTNRLLPLTQKWLEKF